MVKRNYSLLGIALFMVIGSAFCFVRTTVGQVLRICDGRRACTLNAFSQSIGDPNVRGPAMLNIVSETTDGRFQGSIMVLGITYSITGEVDAAGNLGFRSGPGPRPEIKGDGKLQDLTRGGALIQATYKLSSGDQGEIILLRNFTQPPDPGPPAIAGSWRGTYESSWSLTRGTDEWMIQQDRTPTGAPGTGFTGQETLDTGTPAVVLYQFAGTIDGQGNFVRIGVSIRGFVIEGGKLESGDLTAHSVRTHGGHQNDDLVYVLTRYD